MSRASGRSGLLPSEAGRLIVTGSLNPELGTRTLCGETIPHWNEPSYAELIDLENLP